MRVNNEFIAREIKGEIVLLNLKTGDYFSMNTVGNDIYEGIRENFSIEDIIKKINDSYDVDMDTARRDVESLVQSLLDNKILLEDE